MKLTSNGRAIVFDFTGAEENLLTQFLSDLRGVPFTKWISGKSAEYSLMEFSERARMSHIKEMERACEKNDVELSKEVKTIFAEYAEKREEETRKLLQAEEERKKREKALSRLQHGCGWCLQLKLNANNQYFCGANGKPCATSATEMELKFEEWKLTKRFSKLTPFPNTECKYLEVLR